MKWNFKTVILNAFFALIFFAANAQQKHFIYIQSDNNQPFYVNLNNTIYSSTTNGYLNISQLVQGKYYLALGFPKNMYPEQKFIVDIDDNIPGIGFTLKKTSEKEWMLVNYITNEVIKNDVDPILTKTQPTETPKPTSSNTADTPSSSNMTVAKSETNAAPAISGVTAAATSVLVSTVGHQQPKPTASTVVKAFEKTSQQGIDMIFVDQSSSKKADTIALFIPAAVKDTSNNTIPQKKSTPVCTAVANNEDFYKLRMFMAAASTEEAMIVAAEKSFATKCFTVAQIKNLGVLFLEEENKLNFFKAAQTHLADPANFTVLENQLTKPAIIEAFRNLTKKG